MLVIEILMLVLDFNSAIASIIQDGELGFCLLMQFLADANVLKPRGHPVGFLKCVSHPRERSIYLWQSLYVAVGG